MGRRAVGEGELEHITQGLEDLLALPPTQQAQAVGERLVQYASAWDPSLATTVTAQLLERGIPECIRLLKAPEELQPLVAELVAKATPAVVIRPDRAAAAEHRVMEPTVGRAAYVTNNWWKETREQYKGFGNPTPEILRLLRIRSNTAAALGTLGPLLLQQARQGQQAPDAPADPALAGRVLFAVRPGRGSAVMRYTEGPEGVVVEHLVANTMLPGEGDAQLALILHVAALAASQGVPLRLRDTVTPTLYGDPTEFGFDEALVYQGL